MTCSAIVFDLEPIEENLEKFIYLDEIPEKDKGLYVINNKNKRVDIDYLFLN